jgi:hypothetical protein
MGASLGGEVLPITAAARGSANSFHGIRPTEPFERVVSTLVKSLAGWLAQDGTFESELTVGSDIERNQLGSSMIAHRRDAGHSQTLAEATELISSGHLWAGVSASR